MPNRHEESDNLHSERFGLNETIVTEFGDSWEKEFGYTKDSAWVPSDETLSGMMDLDMDTCVSSASEMDSLKDGGGSCFWNSQLHNGVDDTNIHSNDLTELNLFSANLAGDYNSFGMASTSHHAPTELWDITQENLMRYPSVVQDGVSMTLEQTSPTASVASCHETRIQPDSFVNVSGSDEIEELSEPFNSSFGTNGSSSDFSGATNVMSPGAVWNWLLNDSYTKSKPATSVTESDHSDTKVEAPPTNGRREYLEKNEKRKSKPIARRFKEFGSVSVTPSYVQCLNVVLDYHGYTGVIRNVIINEAITNVAYHRHNPHEQMKHYKRAVEETYILKDREQLMGCVPNDENRSRRQISLISGTLQRKIHIRDISEIINAVSSIAYVKSERFHINNPYEPQYYRFELDDKGKVVNESKCGLCAFCPTVKFLPFKNSSYLSHMTLEHGVFASNYIVPEGLYYGKYLMLRANDPTKTRVVKALQCPACFQIIEVSCWKNKTNPLLSYFRHFKKVHSNLNKTFTVSSIDPASLKHRGADSGHDSNSSHC